MSRWVTYHPVNVNDSWQQKSLVMNCALDGELTLIVAYTGWDIPGRKFKEYFWGCKSSGQFS
ncbi:hypothetical protein GCM10011450_27330 [Advenella faeciporci]|uniref:Uncharacterized protein n=1 Tax=Advenella faeciporci TaxID=797535 RepID=A0A918JQ22_9BURK|nr:hypothetical protein GCM10011450_27330 [Advenella faeciporci]